MLFIFYYFFILSPYIFYNYLSRTMFSINATFSVNPQMLSEITPLVIVLSFMIPTGIFGNVFVIYIYASYTKKSNIERFLVALAAFNLVGCTVGMPLGMIDLRLTTSYPSIHICKLYKLVIIYCFMTTSFTLLTISVERYYKKCRSLKRQLSEWDCKALCFLIAFVSLLTSLPVIFYSDVFVLQSHTDKYIICAYNTGLWFWIYMLFILVFHIILLIITTTLITYVHFYLKRYRLGEIQMINTTKEMSTSTVEHKNQTNVIFIMLSLVYIVSFTPNFVLNVTYPLFKNVSLLQNVKRILERFWILNSCLNPVICGLCYRKCRKHFSNAFNISEENSVSKSEDVL
uniref:G-protein coupled receptors family 1 profile domain-containing protein n=1 Tax=Octopus bimaculoides TaxID=37653 RepID=A0A0L8HM64_OCTBM